MHISRSEEMKYYKLAHKCGNVYTDRTSPVMGTAIEKQYSGKRTTNILQYYTVM